MKKRTVYYVALALIIALVLYLRREKGVVEGALAPDFSITAPGGGVIKLSDYRGKFVVLDFWASWCPPCRKASPHLVKLYEEFKGTQLEFIGISLDSDKEAWERAIAADGLNWVQVSNLRKWECEVRASYGVKSIPHLVLINPQGKVLGSKLSASELEELLRAIKGKGKL